MKKWPVWHAQTNLNITSFWLCLDGVGFSVAIIGKHIKEPRRGSQLLQGAQLDFDQAWWNPRKIELWPFAGQS